MLTAGMFAFCSFTKLELQGHWVPEQRFEWIKLFKGRAVMLHIM